MKAKRYYWIKLDEGFFESGVVRRLRLEKNGDIKTIIYLRLLQRAALSGGVLTYEHVRKSFGEEVAPLIMEDADIVRQTVKFLIKEGLCVVEGDRYSFPKAVGMTGSECRTASLMRQARFKDEVSQCDTNVTQALSQCDSIQEIEKEKETEIKTETEQEKDAEVVCGRFANVFLTKEEDDALRAQTKERYDTLVEDLSEYIASTGKQYNSHFATLLAWDKRKTEEQARKAPPKRYESKISKEELDRSLEDSWQIIKQELAGCDKE